MAVATYTPTPAQAHYGSPTIRPMQRQAVSIVTPVRTQPKSQSKQMTRQPSPPRGSRPRQHIWVVTGPAGCGKTTVGQGLAQHFGVPYVEGDDHHPQSNREKMSKNIPLTDADRWDWLIALRDHAINVLAQPPPSNPSTNADTTLLPPPAVNAHNPPTAVVVTCSALKLKYRDEFRVAPLPIHARGLAISVHFIYLAISETLSLERVSARQGHYMGPAMVTSQFASLQPPSEREKAQDVLEVDVDQTPEKVMQDVIAGVGELLDEDEERWSWETRCAC